MPPEASSKHARAEWHRLRGDERHRWTKAGRDVVLEASNSTGFEGKALLSGTIADGSSHTAPPMDNETHVEADVYVSARLDASWSSEGTSSAGLRALVNAELAATLSASATYASDVDACADAILAPLPRSGRQQPRVLTWARQRSL